MKKVDWNKRADFRVKEVESLIYFIEETNNNTFLDAFRKENIIRQVTSQARKNG